MGDMGLEGAYGAVGASDALRQIIKDRLIQQQVQFENARQTANDARLAEEHAAAMQDRQEQHANAQQDRQTGLANTLGDQIPAGTEMAPTDQGVGLLQGGGRGSLLRGNMTLPSTQTAGGMTMPDDSGPTQITGTLRSMSSPEALRSYTKLPSEKQSEYADTADAKVEAARVAAEAKAEGAKAKPLTLSQGGKSAKAAIEQAAPLTDRVMEMIRQEAPDIETNPQKYNGVMAKGHSILQTMKYKAGFADDTDPRQQLVSLLQPIQAGQYTRSSRSREMLNLALKHMADPSQTLLTQYQRAKELKAIMPEMLEGIVRGEMPVDPANPLGGSYLDPAKQPAAAGDTGHPSMVKNGWNYEWKGDRYTAVSPATSAAPRPSVAPATAAPAAGVVPTVAPSAPPQRLPSTPLDASRYPEAGQLASPAPRMLGNTISPQGRADLQEREGGFVGDAYDDVNGPAVGYGMHEWQGKPVTADMHVEKPAADAEMDRQIKAKYGRVVDESLRVPVSQPQYDALVSMAWNLPAAAKRVIEKLNNGEPITSQDFQVSATVHGKHNKGLGHRRDSEFSGFMGTP